MELDISPQKTSLHNQLRLWHQQHVRSFPWRATKVRDPWATLVSEILLTQTQAERVGPYFEAILGAYPSPSVLSRAPLANLLSLWKGLGYYNRAERLWRSARIISDRHGGEVPSEYSELRRLPGVGDYIAKAVLAIAFNQQVAPVDTNIRRVISRVSNTPADRDRDIAAIAISLTPQDRPSDHVEALFDLGALICTARNPSCDICPLRAQICLWSQTEQTDPSLRRSQVSRQPFEGSIRQLRAQLLKDVLGAPEGLSLTQATRNLGDGVSPEDFERALSGLIKDGVLTLHHDKLEISRSSSPS